MSLALVACAPAQLGWSTSSTSPEPKRDGLKGGRRFESGSDDDNGDLAATRTARSREALAIRDAFFAKDCAALKDGDFDAVLAGYRRSPAVLSIEDRVQIAVKFVTCKRDVELFEKVVAGVNWDAFIEKFPKEVGWLPRLEAYVASGNSRFPDYEQEGYTVSNLWVWVRIAKRDGTSEALCKAAFARRGNLAALSAGAPLAFACSNAGNVKAVTELVPALLSSESWAARKDGCDVLAIAPQAATPKVARVVKEMSHADPYKVWDDEHLRFPVRERCAIASKKIELVD